MQRAPERNEEMSPGILGRKIGMTQVFRPDGQVVPVTLLKAGPCIVVQRKTPATDGYDAVQLGLLEFVKPKRINKPATGHLKKAGAEGAKFLREFRLDRGNGSGDSEGRRPGSGQRLQAEREGRRDRRFERPRICRRREAPSFPRRRRHRTVRCSTARLVRSALRASLPALFPACAWADIWAMSR